MAEPTETMPITLFAMPVLAARTADGRIVLAIRDLCATVGLSRPSQMRRIRADEDLRMGLVTLRIRTSGGSQEQEFLELEMVPLWITGISRRKADPEIQQRLRYLKLFIIGHVHDAITSAAGLPTGSSRNIEDLADLARYDEALQGLAARQQAMEESQEKARDAWRDMNLRLQALEARVFGSLSKAQGGHIYELIHSWANARVAHERVSIGEALSACWGAIKVRYGVAKYEHIPSAKYEDCVAYIKRAYRRLTGQDMPEGQQGTLDLE